MHENLRGHLLMKGSRIPILKKLTSKELYQVLISSGTNKITSVTYIETIFNANHLDWTKIFILPRVTTYNTNHISSNKCPQHLLNFEALRCGTYYREALISKLGE